MWCSVAFTTALNLTMPLIENRFNCYVDFAFLYTGFLPLRFVTVLAVRLSWNTMSVRETPDPVLLFAQVVDLCTSLACRCYPWHLAAVSACLSIFATKAKLLSWCSSVSFVKFDVLDDLHFMLLHESSEGCIFLFPCFSQRFFIVDWAKCTNVRVWWTAFIFCRVSCFTHYLP